MGKQFEYKVEFLTSNHGQLEKHLQQRGAYGWQVVGLSGWSANEPCRWSILLMRELSDDPHRTVESDTRTGDGTSEK